LNSGGFISLAINERTKGQCSQGSILSAKIIRSEKFSGMAENFKPDIFVRKVRKII
jgi:hypothetical protein